MYLKGGCPYISLHIMCSFSFVKGLGCTVLLRFGGDIGVYWLLVLCSLFELVDLGI